MADREVNLEISTVKKGTGAEKTAKALDKLEKETKSANRAAEALRKESSKLRNENLDLSKSLDKEADKLDNLADKARLVTSEKKKAEKSSRNMGTSILYASQAYEDLNYGIRGVLNNIPQLVLSLGGTAGLAGVISLAAVSASQLGGAFDTSKKKASELDDEVEDLATTISNLVEAQVKEFTKTLNDDELLKGFIESQGKAEAATKDVSEAIKTQIKEARALRNIDLEVLDSEAARQAAEVSESTLSESEKIAKLAEIRTKVEKAKQEAEQKNLKDTLNLTQTEIGEAEAKLEALEKRAKNITRLDGKVKDSSRRQKEARDDYEKLLKKFIEVDISEQLKNSTAIDGSDNTERAKRLEIQKRRGRIAAELAASRGVLEDANNSKDFEKVRDILEIISKLSAKNEEERGKTSTSKSLGDRSLEKFSALAEKVLNKSNELNSRTEDLNDITKKQEADLEFVKDFDKKRGDLTQKIDKLRSSQRVLEAQLEAQPRIDSNNQAAKAIDTAKKSQAANEKDISREFGEIAQSLDKVGEKGLAPPEKVKALKDKLDALDDKLEQYTSDGDYTDSEKSDILRQSRNLKREAAGLSAELSENFTQVIDALSMKEVIQAAKNSAKAEATTRAALLQHFRMQEAKNIRMTRDIQQLQDAQRQSNRDANVPKT